MATVNFQQLMNLYGNGQWFPVQVLRDLEAPVWPQLIKSMPFGALLNT